MVKSSAALLAVYLLIGRKLRSWLPLWVYVLPVTGTGALVLTFVAVPFEHAHLFVMGRAGIFGWLDPQYLPRVAYLAIMPGIVGERAAHGLPRAVLSVELELRDSRSAGLIASGTLVCRTAGVASRPTFVIS